LWTQAADQMAAGAWGDALVTLVEINGSVMQARGGSPWMRRGDDGVLDVRLPIGVELPHEEAVVSGWRNPYYLDPLWSVQRGLSGGQR
jgi:hypothetical protein